MNPDCVHTNVYEAPDNYRDGGYCWTYVSADEWLATYKSIVRYLG